jgi:hypothetical protein
MSKAQSAYPTGDDFALLMTMQRYEQFEWLDGDKGVLVWFIDGSCKTMALKDLILQINQLVAAANHGRVRGYDAWPAINRAMAFVNEDLGATLRVLLGN